VTPTPPDRPRAAVYDRYWRSQGGGERHAGMVAQVLAADGAAVDLIGHEETDLDELADHLGLDLSACRYRQVPDRGELALAEVTADYDLFVNATYMSRIPSKARRSAYLCFFPTPPDHDLSAWRKAVARRVGPHVSGIVENIEYGKGWFPPEGGRRRTWVWTSGDGILTLPPGERRRLSFAIGRPGAPRPATVRLVDDSGREHAVLRAEATWNSHVVDLGPSPEGAELHWLSDTFVPGGSAGGVDDRTLGVAVSRAHLVGAAFGPRQRLAGRFPWLLRSTVGGSWLDSYDVVLANSAYTAGWVGSLWGDGPAARTQVLYPPIATQELHPAGRREHAVVTVGRFFAPGLGHAKRQLEMVQAFGRLHMERRLPGWRLHVVGGCEPSQEPYLDAVRTAAAGLPVTVLTNAPRAEVERLLSTASIFWSATGLGADAEAEPWNAEHFGMTTVEAMAGGCVPVVIDRAGQREIVREGVDGFRWDTLDDLLDRTVEVARDEALRARLAASAVGRAAAYDEDAFRTRWRSIAASADLLP